MKIYIQSLIILPILIVCFQFYLYSVSQNGENKQNSCRTLGIAYMSLGITSLISRSIPFAFGGLILIMLGFRLIAHGLDRMDKQVFIDRFDEDQ